MNDANSQMSHNADVLIVTATPIERQAVLQVSREVSENPPSYVRIDKRTYDDLGEINGMSIYMTLSKIGSYGPGGSQETIQKGIQALNPSYVLLVGIAFGFNEHKQKIGDVLVSTQLCLYDSERIGASQNILRGGRPDASSDLINYFRVFSEDWGDTPVDFGLIMTGSKLVDNLPYRNKLKQLEPEAIGGEMEGGGLYTSCYSAGVDWIVVKAICDWADGKKAEEQENRQHVAAFHAARFVFNAFQKVSLLSDDPKGQRAFPNGDATQQDVGYQKEVDSEPAEETKQASENPPIEIECEMIGANEFFTDMKLKFVGEVYVVPVQPNGAMRIEVSGDGGGPRPVRVQVVQPGLLAVSWIDPPRAIEISSSKTIEGWPYGKHAWEFERLDLTYPFEVGGNQALEFSPGTIIDAWRIWHKAINRSPETFIVMLGNVSSR